MEIRIVKYEDKNEWFKLDKHISEDMFVNKVENQQGYVLIVDEKVVGVLRYSLFWDSIPFCNMLFIDEAYRSKGYGKKLMFYWEQDMKDKGYGMVLTSTQVDELAQHFYRLIGYKDCGCLLLDIPGYSQPAELFMAKKI